jgi:hypothetical protein
MPVMENEMKSVNTKVLLSTFGIVAMLTSPAFAQKRHITPANRSAVYNVMPGYDESGVMPGYNGSGAVVEIPNVDRHAIQSQR